MDRKLPDTPWHVGYTKKKEADPRRHKARCIFYKKDKTCRCLNSPYFRSKCGGSAHCMYYEEPEELELELDAEAKKIVNENRRAKTVEEEAEERAYRYKQRKIAQRKKLEMIGAEELHKRYGKALVCPVCGEDFRPNKVCPYCGLRV